MSLQGRNERTVQSGSENSRLDRSGASIEIRRNRAPANRDDLAQGVHAKQ